VVDTGSYLPYNPEEADIRRSTTTTADIDTMLNDLSQQVQTMAKNAGMAGGSQGDGPPCGRCVHVFWASYLRRPAMRSGKHL